MRQIRTLVLREPEAGNCLRPAGGRSEMIVPTVNERLAIYHRQILFVHILHLNRRTDLQQWLGELLRRKYARCFLRN